MELEESVLKLDAGFDKAKAVAENLFVHFPCLGSLKNQLFSVFKSEMTTLPNLRRLLKAYFELAFEEHERGLVQRLKVDQSMEGDEDVLDLDEAQLRAEPEP